MSLATRVGPRSAFLEERPDAAVLVELPSFFLYPEGLERLARGGRLVSYDVVEESGPPHDRTFAVRAVIDGAEAGRGVGRSKKDAEQEAAQAALEAMEG